MEEVGGSDNIKEGAMGTGRIKMSSRLLEHLLELPGEIKFIDWDDSGVATFFVEQPNLDDGAELVAVCPPGMKWTPVSGASFQCQLEPGTSQNPQNQGEGR